MLAPNTEHKVFLEVPIVEFCDGKSLKDYLRIDTLPKIDNIGGSESCGKDTCLVYHYIFRTIIFATEARGRSIYNSKRIA